jgi:uncharacterized protein
MYVGGNALAGEATSQERRAADQPNARALGHVVQCDGARATIAANIGKDEVSLAGAWTVGKLISINLGSTRTVGLIYAIERAQRVWEDEGGNPLMISVELIGEVRDRDGAPFFDRGVTEYPHIGALAHRIRSRDLRAIYDLGGRRSIGIGRRIPPSTPASRWTRPSTGTSRWSAPRA